MRHSCEAVVVFRTMAWAHRVGKFGLRQLRQ